MVRRGIEDEIAGLSYTNKQAALISVVSRGEDQENEYEKEAVISGNKGGKLAVWWASSEESNTNNERQTIGKHDNLNQGECSHKSKYGRCQGRKEGTRHDDKGKSGNRTDQKKSHTLN